MAASTLFKAAIFAACILVSLAIQPKLNAKWAEYKAYHKKVYRPLEDLRHRQTWEENLMKISIHNLEESLGQHTWTMGVNAFTDLTAEEFKQMHNCNRKGNNQINATFFEEDGNVQLPKFVDWRKKGAVTPIKDQGQCGSCWAFSSIASLEGLNAIKNKKLANFSEQQLVDCSKKDHGCNGGLMVTALSYTAKNGIESEKGYPYKAKDQQCAFNKSEVVFKNKGVKQIAQGSEIGLTKAVAQVGPISVAIDASHGSFQMYQSGVYYEPQCDPDFLDHGVTVVGYGTENQHPYYLVKNSWGTGWGDKGYIKMSRNRKNNCGIASMASFPTL